MSGRAFRGQHQPQSLRFDPAKLKGLSEKLIWIQSALFIGAMIFWVWQSQRAARK